MSPKRLAARLRPVIVEVEGYEGRDTALIVWNDRAEPPLSEGKPGRMYCIGAMSPDGIIRLDSCGWPTADAARRAVRARYRAMGLAPPPMAGDEPTPRPPGTGRPRGGKTRSAHRTQ